MQAGNNPGKAARRRRFVRVLSALLLTIALVFAGYGAAGLIGGAIPANAAWQPPEQGIRIYIEDNGIHTGIVVPKRAAGVDWNTIVRSQDIADPRYAAYDHLAFGWGDRAFYIGTPRWADVRPATVLRAAIGSNDTVLHVEHVPVPEPGGRVRTVLLRPQEYRRLAGFIRASFAPGAPRARHGYGPYDAFYAGEGRYSALNTCNSWTGAALRFAGVRMGVWTPLPVSVMMSL
ncbi:TIGR02117 family protein [Stakelama pacifica]|uniref:Uncharacterized protein (TIGR02117 family) n=1 Tax=Stakelama pacifica TaxID=517720 RepID=A0A4R6FL30_9SPHN|nr:TIGR02117 family protein [Stakelama pacifica]TDN82231.1 uncharacterized protein (TIGR02117 family) [Stakelama pacifica]GGO95899.1 hypothetical protein GCM10011329_21180 [Stakelama pacifica]